MHFFNQYCWIKLWMNIAKLSQLSPIIQYVKDGIMIDLLLLYMWEMIMCTCFKWTCFSYPLLFHVAQKNCYNLFQLRYYGRYIFWTLKWFTIACEKTVPKCTLHPLLCSQAQYWQDFFKTLRSLPNSFSHSLKRINMLNHLR